MEERVLPVGWVVAPISELAIKVGSGATPKGGQSAYQPSGIPLIRSMNVVFFGFKKDGLAYINEDQAQLLSNAEVRQGDVLLNITGASIGRATSAPSWSEGARVNQHVCIIRPSESIIQDYLSAYLSSPSIQSFILDENYGVTRQALTKQQVLALEVPVPPLNEQCRIAAKLDTTLAAVDACRQRLDVVAAILKRFRQAVLAAATSGELTREWRKESSIDGQWMEGCLHELLSSKPRNGYSPKPADQETSIKSLTLSATTSGRFKSEHFKYIDQAIPGDSHLWLMPGDILIQRANTLEYVGISAIYDGPEKTFIYPDLMMKCRANDKVDAQYLHYLLLSEAVRNYFRESATGTSGNMPKINQQIVMSAPVRWPTHDEQLEIVGRAQALFTFADQLEARLTSTSKVVDRLTPALLAKAFRGELVPQDPGDEPASVLLERVRAARQAEAGAGKPSRRGRSKAAANPEPVDRNAAPVPSEPFPPDLLTQLLRECGALSERALLAVSELEPERFEQQLFRELEKGTAREVQANGQVLLEAVG